MGFLWCPIKCGGGFKRMTADALRGKKFSCFARSVKGGSACRGASVESTLVKAMDVECSAGEAIQGGIYLIKSDVGEGKG
jgi:hypothetical protein